MKTWRGSRVIAPLILNLGTRWRWVVDLTPRLLYRCVRTTVPIEKEVEWDFWRRELCLQNVENRSKCDIPFHSDFNMFPPQLKLSLINVIIVNRRVWRVSVLISRQIDTATPSSVVCRFGDSVIVMFKNKLLEDYFKAQPERKMYPVLLSQSGDMELDCNINRVNQFFVIEMEWRNMSLLTGCLDKICRSIHLCSYGPNSSLHSVSWNLPISRPIRRTFFPKNVT